MVKTSMLKIRILLLSFCFLGKFVFSQSLKSGFYYGSGYLYLVKKADRVCGYFKNSIGRNEEITTIFYFVGIKDSRCSCFKIKTFYPELDGASDTIRGTIKPKSDTTFDMKLKSDPPGSLFGLHNTDSRIEDSFKLSRMILHSKIAYINVGRATIYRKKDGGEKIRILMASDFVEVLESSDEMYKIAIPESEHVVNGWVSKKDVYVLQ